MFPCPHILTNSVEGRDLAVTLFLDLCLAQINPTKVDWYLGVQIEGLGFSGPPSWLAGAGTTALYPLTFTPQCEGLVQV